MMTNPQIGMLAQKFCNKALPLAVLRSQAGYYIGTFDEDGPCSRESVEYFRNREDALKALKAKAWTQKPEP